MDLCGDIQESNISTYTNSFAFSSSYVCVGGASIVPLCTGPTERPEVSDPLQLELQVALRHPTWVLESELTSSGRAIYTQPMCYLSSTIYITNFSSSVTGEM